MLDQVPRFKLLDHRLLVGSWMDLFLDHSLLGLVTITFFEFCKVDQLTRFYCAFWSSTNIKLLKNMACGFDNSKVWSLFLLNFERNTILVSSFLNLLIFLNFSLFRVFFILISEWSWMKNPSLFIEVGGSAINLGKSLQIFS